MFNSNIRLIAAFLALALTKARSEQLTCREIEDCNSCVQNGCGWSGEHCRESCEDIPGSKCYSFLKYPFLQTEQICNFQREEKKDWDLCASNNDCQSCTSTHLSKTPGNCFWHQEQNGCFPGVISGWSIGTDTCSTPSSSTGPAFSATSSTASTSSSSSTSGTISSSSTSTSTGITSRSSDAASTGSGYITRAAAQPQITKQSRSYSFQSSQEASDACAQVGTGCSSCLENGCHWAANKCVASCSSIAGAACFSAETTGRSPESICAEAGNDKQDHELCSTQEDCNACTKAVKSDGKSSCQWYTDEASGLSWCGTGECDRFGNCGSEACPVPPTAPQQPSLEKSSKEVEDRINRDICRSSSSCEECTSSLKVDGISTCTWYIDVDNKGWCDVGGCDSNGNCGSSDFSTCAAPTNEERGNIRGFSATKKSHYWLEAFAALPTNNAPKTQEHGNNGEPSAKNSHSWLKAFAAVP
ncbi:expressed unknown protein [Seminavis robusta]|uniref:Uncharacterized protein n=1 Tax=Seminavis robusta TaxID=568900 RepID=A0A9N8HTH3_9STRA|nr:expressed unknown protein [Seminavis robusta]|eukprot:Sro1881_g303290.1 n/a (472) ;mRNA; r:6716-8131